MAILTLNSAARFAHKSKTDILRAINDGSLSAMREKNGKGNWQIDTSELIRRFGTETTNKSILEPIKQVLEPLEPPNNREIELLERERKSLLDTIDYLKNQIFVKDEQLKSIQLLLEHQENTNGSKSIEKPPIQNSNISRYVAALTLLAAIGVILFELISRYQ
jgi:hypothetical protein